MYPNIEVNYPYEYNKFINSKEKQESELELYPTLKPQNVKQINKIVDFVERFPL